jgi:hypothetical protein
MQDLQHLVKTEPLDFSFSWHKAKWGKIWETSENLAKLRTGSFPHSFSSVHWIFTKLDHMIALWKGKNPIYFGVIRSKVKVTVTINRILIMWSSLVKIQYTELKLSCGNDPVVKKFIYSKWLISNKFSQGQTWGHLPWPLI